MDSMKSSEKVYICWLKEAFNMENSQPNLRFILV